MSGAAVAERLRQAVVDGDAVALADLLHPQCRFQVLGKTLDGAAVAVELAAETTRAAWAALQWQPAAVAGDALRLVGERAPGTRDRGLIVTLRVEGRQVRHLQLQRVPPPPPAATPMVLPPELRRAIDNALVERHPMLLSHVDLQGQPVLSFRGSLQVLGDDQLGLWVRNAQGGFVQAIAVHPKVALCYRNEDSRATYQLQGRARLSHDPAVRQRVFDHAPEAERAHDFAMLGVAVLIDLDRVEGYAGVGPQGQVGQIHLQRDAR